MTKSSVTRPSVRFLVGGVAAAALACGDGGGNPVAPTPPTTPTNRAPQASQAIPDQEVVAGGDKQLDLQDYFIDPDGDPLTFAATSSEASVVTTSVTGNTLTLVAASPGTANITVTAADPGGLTATQTFNAVTGPPPNRTPLVSAPIPDQTLRLNETETARVDLSLHFTDPDGDPLTFEATSSDARVVTVSVVESVATIAAVSAGTADVTVTAADPGGSSAAQTFTASVEPPPNRAPLVSAPILGRTLKLNESEKATVDLSAHFTDPDGDPLTFEATSSDARVATASVSNGTLTLLARALGTANVTAAASDPGGRRATQAFSVTVEQGRLSAELEVTTCQADAIGLTNVLVEGTVRAVAPLSSARVTAYMDAERLGEQALGDMAAGATREFVIRGSATVTASSRCHVELSAGGGSLAAAASVSFR